MRLYDREREIELYCTTIQYNITKPLFQMAFACSARASARLSFALNCRSRTTGEGTQEMYIGIRVYNNYKSTMYTLRRTTDADAVTSPATVSKPQVVCVCVVVVAP